MIVSSITLSQHVGIHFILSKSTSYLPIFSQVLSGGSYLHASPIISHRVLEHPNTCTSVITYLVYLTLTLVTLFGVTFNTSTPTARYRTLIKYSFYISKMDLYVLFSKYRLFSRNLAFQKHSYLEYF